MTDVNRLIADIKSGKRWGCLEATLLIEEVERLRGELFIAWETTVRMTSEPRGGGWLLTIQVASEHAAEQLVAAGRWQPHPTEPGLYRRKDAK